MGVRFRSLKALRYGLVTIVVVAGGTFTWVIADRAVSKVYQKVRPYLEQTLSKPLGHPLLIGGYRGLRPWGIAIGSTQIKPGLRDESRVTIAGMTIKLAPIASLLNFRPVAVITPQDLKVNLRPNENGQYWVLGPTKGNAPNLGLRLRLLEPAKVLISNSQLQFTVAGNTAFQLANKRVSGSIRLGLPNQGSLMLKGNGHWDRPDVNIRARLNQIELASLNGILPEQEDVETKGKFGGDFQLAIGNGRLDCKGGMNLTDFSIKGGALKNTLSSQDVVLRCNKDLIKLRPSEWSYGPWLASLGAQLPIDVRKTLTLDLVTSLKLRDVNTSGLKVNASLPISFERERFTLGSLSADLNLEGFPLAPIGSLVGTPMAGLLSANGQISGTLPDLKTDLSIGLINPQISSMRLQEEWRGSFVGLSKGGGILKMASTGASVPGSIIARINPNWSINDVNLKRLGGYIFLKNNQDEYLWNAENFRLDRVEVSIPPEKSFKRIFGQLSGQGNFKINPLSLQGQITMRYPRLMGFRLQEVQLDGSYSDNKYKLSGKVSPPESGQISLFAEGLLGGAIRANAQASNLSARWIASTVTQIPKVKLNQPGEAGKAEDLGKFIVQSIEDSLDSSLMALAKSQEALRKEYKLQRKGKFINPNSIAGQLDALVHLEGSDFSNLNLDLKVSGNLRSRTEKLPEEKKSRPFLATIKGPIQRGKGTFSLLNVPFSLLSLVAPLPSSLSGRFGISGRYRMGNENPEVSANLRLDDARFAQNSFVLDRGKASFADSVVKLDLAVRSESSSEPVTVFGEVPLKDSLPIDLRIESHGDGMRFLDGLSGKAVSWTSGTADLKMLIAGSMASPKANGYLVMRDGEFVVMDKPVNGFNSSMIFDFNRLELQKLEASIGSEGLMRGSGVIGLFRSESNVERPLTLEMKNVPFKLPGVDVQVASNLDFKGSLFQPSIGGDLSVKEGTISPQLSKSGRSEFSQSVNTSPSSPRTQQKQLPEQSWDLQEPLVLFVQDDEAPASKMLRNAIPSKFSRISFDDLKLRLGPNLRITSQPFATFNTAGLLVLNGAFDQTLNASGVVRLTSGRVNFFTTTFNLDRREPNVAVFTPSMGLIPYLDVTMTTRVPDTVRDASNLASSGDFATNGSGAFGIGGSRFAKVELKAIGPADRLADNFQLRSTPPMPRNQLLGLIGGNSLTRLLGGGEGEVLASVLSRSLISPVLGNITGSFSERLQLSLYPAYVNAPDGGEESSNDQSTGSDNLSPQQAWVTEVGVDLSDRFNFSVQATPNREDIPPQGTLAFQVNPNLGLLGSLDNNGSWQSQVQMFVRF